MKSRRVVGVLVILALLLPMAASRSLAQGTVRDPIDIVLIIDNSGSMGDGGMNDIEGLRFAAARLLVDLAAEGDRVAVVQFSNSASVLGAESACSAGSMAGVAAIDPSKCPLVEIDAGSRQALLNDYQLPDNVVGYTCMQNALGLSARLLAAAGGNRPQAILFLTDGDFDCSAAGQDDLSNAINTLSQMNVVTYPIILGQQVKDDVADRLADTSGGRVFRAASAGDLLPAFAAFYAALQPSRYAVPLMPPPGVNQVEFITTAEQKVTEINFVVAHNSLNGLSLNNTPLSPGGLPQGGTYTIRQDNNATGEPKYDIHQLRGNPLIGTWVLNMTGGASRGLAVVEAGVAPALAFPRGEQVFAARHVSQRDDGYLLVPIAASNGQQDSNITVNAPGQALDNSPANLNFRGVPRSQGKFDYDIRVGDSVNPLVLQRSFEIRPGNFPRLEIVEVSPGVGSVLSHFEVRWGAAGGPAPADTQIEMYVVDSSGTVAWHAKPEDFVCDAGVCVHDGFSPPPGRTHTVWFLASAISGGTLFSDYAVADLASDPRLTVRDLPDTIDLAENPGPFTIEIAVQSETDPGNLAVELYSNGAPAAVQPSLALLGELIPGSTVGAQLSFPDLAGLPVTGFSGELILRAGAVRVAPDRRPVVYRPRVELTLPEDIDLSRNLGPYVVTARQVGGVAPTTISARVEDSSAGGPSIIADLNLQLRPGETTTGSLEFTRKADLVAGNYPGIVIFETGDGRPVEPASLPVRLSLEPVEVKYTLEGTQLNFGYWIDPAQPVTAGLTLEYKNRPVEVRAEIEGLTSGAPLRATVTTPGNPTGPGPHEAEIAIMVDGLADDLPTGELTGNIRLYVDDPIGGTVSPSEPISFRANRPSYLEIFFWCDENNRVPTWPLAQQIVCNFFWPRQTVVTEESVETRMNWWTPIRLFAVLSVWVLGRNYLRKDTDDDGGGSTTDWKEWETFDTQTITTPVTSGRGPRQPGSRSSGRRPRQPGSQSSGRGPRQPGSQSSGRGPRQPRSPSSGGRPRQPRSPSNGGRPRQPRSPSNGGRR